MYGLTAAEVAHLDANVDRPQSGLNALERRLILNAARAGNVEAIRCIEDTLRGQGCSRHMARHKLAQLRALGPVTGLDEDSAFADFMTFLKDLQ